MGSNVGDNANTAMPIGTFIKNTHGQSNQAVMIPPKNTPAVPPTGAAAPHMPIALFISDLFAENRFITMDRAEGAIKAAPKPL